jgi:GTP-binding protein
MSEIKAAEFVKSSQSLKECPDPSIPEFAFIGRSNVGKSSLINMICQRKKLAKTSSTPGKTQLINHFLIDEKWYLVDLPGYGYAKVSKSQRSTFGKMIKDYILNRQNLINVYVLVDSRHSIQKIDLEFMQWLGEKGIPFSIVFTKADKISSSALNKNITQYKKKILEHWESLPPCYITSSISQAGKDEILGTIQKLEAALADEVKEHFLKHKN